ncbi:TetR/AcrR family transcriptional regulator [Streptomyces griseosporeus]|uniref:TetR/AcrR family transcriptional regulator n=1 Tax=Streptomyces griseosporeus TaxID=1910 RepID=UPI0036F868D6
MEIARAAARLFVTHGLRATRAEDIAQAAGVAPRTFYRYFAAKEEAVAPLYAVGARRWTEAVRSAPAELGLPEALEHAVRYTLTPGGGVSAASWEWVRTLVRLAEASPALHRVWAETCHVAEGELAEVLAVRGACPGLAGRGGPGAPGGLDNVAPGPGVRFAAAVAGAAVRVAVEEWAVGEGADGPVEAAVRNLEAVRGFLSGGLE